ncbi:hypothetical protein [Paenibacillus sp.]|jgi:hypothetical protein|nr:hypothetical protein [Paenibacillus sp.]
MSDGQTAIRINKLEALQAQGINIYPEKFDKNYERVRSKRITIR